jgi:hypothetical protein
MEGKIFLRAVRHLLDPADPAAPRPEFRIVAATLGGEIIDATANCTSSNFKNDTFNFRFPESGEVRTIHACLLLSVNGREVML